MHFPFDIKKAIAATALLITEHKSRHLKRLRLQKLLYIAEKESLRLAGSPIVGDALSAMKHGPVLSHTLNLMRGNEIDAEWSMYFATKGHDLILLQNPGVDELSHFEVATLKQAARKHLTHTVWTIRDLTHEFPEWKSHYIEGTSRPIPLTDILRESGRSDDEAREVVFRAEYEMAFKKKFAHTSK
jgi:uncharacterized phage-associated protein